VAIGLVIAMRMFVSHELRHLSSRQWTTQMYGSAGCRRNASNFPKPALRGLCHPGKVDADYREQRPKAGNALAERL
jgi:hypothetical protein